REIRKGRKRNSSSLFRSFAFSCSSSLLNFELWICFGFGASDFGFMIKAEIISVGSELASGQNLDTNSQWLSQRLAEIGIAVGWHTTIADDLDANVEAFRIAVRRARLVIATGGLGPTLDDLTRDAVAKAAGVELVLDPRSL